MVKVYKVTRSDSSAYAVFEDSENVLEYISSDLAVAASKTKFKIEVKEVSQKWLDNLPDFEGWD